MSQAYREELLRLLEQHPGDEAIQWFMRTAGAPETAIVRMRDEPWCPGMVALAPPEGLWSHAGHRGGSDAGKPVLSLRAARGGDEMSERLAGEELDRLFDAVCGMAATRAVAQPEVVRAVYGLLGAGQPVTASRVGAALAWEDARGQRALEGLPNVDVDDRGAVVGFGGLTLRPTPHRIRMDGQVRYAWCAWDALFLPVALDAQLEVASRCPRTGRPITVTVGPTGVVERNPDTVVLSFVQPDTVDATDLRGSFCGAVHFLADAGAAAAWTAQAPGRVVLDLDDAFELGRRMILERCGGC